MASNTDGESWDLFRRKQNAERQSGKRLIDIYSEINPDSSLQRAWSIIPNDIKNRPMSSFKIQRRTKASKPLSGDVENMYKEMFINPVWTTINKEYPELFKSDDTPPVSPPSLKKKLLGMSDSSTQLGSVIRSIGRTLSDKDRNFLLDNIPSRILKLPLEYISGITYYPQDMATPSEIAETKLKPLVPQYIYDYIVNYVDLPSIFVSPELRELETPVRGDSPPIRQRARQVLTFETPPESINESIIGEADNPSEVGIGGVVDIDIGGEDPEDESMLEDLPAVQYLPDILSKKEKEKQVRFAALPMSTTAAESDVTSSSATPIATERSERSGRSPFRTKRLAPRPYTTTRTSLYAPAPPPTDFDPPQSSRITITPKTRYYVPFLVPKNEPVFENLPPRIIRPTEREQRDNFLSQSDKRRQSKARMSAHPRRYESNIFDRRSSLLPLLDANEVLDLQQQTVHL